MRSEIFNQPLSGLAPTAVVKNPRHFGFQGIRAKVVEIPESLDSFQSLQEILGRLKRKFSAPTLTPSQPSPTTSVMTVFLSGSKPGEYTTSLRTITLTTAAEDSAAAVVAEQQQRRGRRKRQIAPQPALPQHIQTTVVYKPILDWEDSLSSLDGYPGLGLDPELGLDLQGSIPALDGGVMVEATQRLHGGAEGCGAVTVTVTVTHDGCQP